MTYSANTIIQGLYGITHHDHLSQQQLLDDVEAALKGGMQVLQFRDKQSTSEEKKHRASGLLELCQQYQKPLIINDDPLLCKMIGAQGVHLGQEDSKITQAREILGEQAVIGATCHASVELAVNAQRQGANYIALGSFFPSKTKTRAAIAPLTCIAEVKQQCKLPLVAIGGITLDNASSLIDAQVDAIAVINALFFSEDIHQQAQKFSTFFKE